MDSDHENLLKEFEEFEEHCTSGRHFREGEGGVAVERQKPWRICGKFEAAGTRKSRGTEKTSRTGGSFSPTVLPPIDLRLVRRGARLLL